MHGFLRKFCTLVFLGLLAACGGGGSGGNGGNGDSDSGNGGGGGGTVQFDEFLNLLFAQGNSWDFFWSYDDDHPLDGVADETGTVTVTLGAPSQHPLPGGGTLTMFSVSYTGLGPYPLIWKQWDFVGVHEGVIYGKSGATVEALFDATDGSAQNDGYIGYFSDDRPETASNVTFINSGGDRIGAVQISEPFFDPDCQIIAGVEVCDGVFDNYDVREFFNAEFGFVGFHRSGTSAFSGPFPDIFSSDMNVSLLQTNLKCDAPDQEPNNSMNDIVASPLSFHSLCSPIAVTQGTFNTASDPDDWYSYRTYDDSVQIGADVCVNTPPLPCGELHIHVYDANGTLISNTDLNPADPSLFSMDFAVTPGQLLFIRVQAIDSLGGNAEYSVRVF